MLNHDHKDKKVDEEVKFRSQKKKEDELAVHMIAKKLSEIYTRNIFDAFRFFPKEPKRFILRAYRIAFAKDKRRMEELEETHPKRN